MQTRIIASLDIGTNSVILLIQEYNNTKRIKFINEFIATTRLGENLSVNGLLENKSIERTNDAIAEMTKIVEMENVQELIVTATSAVRDAKNKTSFLLQCNQKFNIFPHGLGGLEEAKLTYKGAVSQITNPNIPVVMFDIGGGSTEIAFGTKNNIIDAVSCNFGGIRTTETFALNNNLNYPELIFKSKMLKRQIVRNMESFNIKFFDWLKTNDTPKVIVCGGTATTYAAILNKQYVYDRNNINSTSSNINDVMTELKRISKMSVENRKRIPGMENDRAAIMPAGLMILHILLKIYDLDDFSVTVNGLRTGIIQNFIENETIKEK